MTHFSHVFVWEDEKQKTEMEDNGGAARTAGVAGGTAVSSTPSDDLEMQEGQDDKAVAGSGTHLAGVVGKSRTKVTHSNYITQLQYTHKSYTPPKPPIWSCTTSGNTNPRKFRQNLGTPISCDWKIMSCVCCTKYYDESTDQVGDSGL